MRIGVLAIFLNNYSALFDRDRTKSRVSADKCQVTRLQKVIE